MTVWQFNAAVQGWIDVHVPDEGGPSLSAAEADEIWAWMQEKEGRVVQ